MNLNELRSIHDLINGITKNDFDITIREICKELTADYHKIGWNEFCNNRIEYILRVNNKLGEALLRKAIERHVKTSARLERIT